MKAVRTWALHLTYFLLDTNTDSVPLHVDSNEHGNFGEPYIEYSATNREDQATLEFTLYREVTSATHAQIEDPQSLMGTRSRLVGPNLGLCDL